MCKKELSPFVLLATAVVFVVLVVIKITCLLEASARAQNVAMRAASQHKLRTPDAGEAAADPLAVAEQLKKHNLFSPPQQPRHPVSSVLGILGNEALIGDRWYKAGDNIADAEIVSVEPTHVRIRWQGGETVLAPIQMASQAASGGSRPAPGNLRQANQGRMLGRRAPVTVRSGRAERSQTGRSVKLLEENKTNSNEKADKKQQALTENQRYQKLLKQDINSPKNERTARKKRASDASATKRGVSADTKKMTRRPAR